MDILLGLLSLVFFAASSFVIVRWLKPATVHESVLFWYPVFTGIIVLCGFCLSALNELSNIMIWMLASLAFAGASMAVVRRGDNVKRVIVPRFNLSLRDSFSAFRVLPVFRRFVVGILFATAAVVVIFNLMVILLSYPCNWDSMTYHLARVAYYVQHGNFNYFDADYWAQVVHPKNSAILLLYTLLASGLDEKLTQLVQFSAYLVLGLSVFGIVRKLGHDLLESVTASSISLLLIECVMESTTTQNDILIAAYLGIAVYCIMSYRVSSRRSYVVVAAVSIGLGIGTKPSMLLALPSLFFVAVFMSPGTKILSRIKAFGSFLLLTIFASALLALPSGYFENTKVFGNPFGPVHVRTQHSFEGSTAGSVVVNGTKNMFRYALDSFSFDGIPRFEIVKAAQHTVREVPVSFVSLLGLDLMTKEGSRVSFDENRDPRSTEDYSGWGVFGFGLAAVAVVLSVFRLRKSQDTAVLAIAATIFFIAQAYAGPYDPWRGRYFIGAVPLVIPLVAELMQCDKYLLGKVYIGCLVVLGCSSALFGSLFPESGTIFSVETRWFKTNSFLALDRIGQLTREKLWLWYGPMKRFDQIVPDSAVVATMLPPDTYEYPLFGPGFRRKILPLNSFSRGRQPVPAEAQYLLYSDRYLPPDPSDVFLGGNLYLQKLR